MLVPAPVWGPSCGLQSSTNCFNVGPSHGMQSFRNCSNVGPFHGVQSLRNQLLQCGCPEVSQVLPANPLWVGSSPWATVPAQSLLLHRLSASVLQGISTCSGVGSSMGCRLDIYSTADFHGLQGDNLCHHRLLHGLQVKLCSWTCSTSSPPSSLTLVPAELFFSHIHTPASHLVCSTFYSFLNKLSQRLYQHHWWAQLCPAAGLSWSRLELALSDMGKASAVFSQKSPLQPPHYKKLATETQYRDIHKSTGVCC